MVFKLDVDWLMHGVYVHAHFDDLDLDARSQWFFKGKTDQL